MRRFNKKLVQQKRGSMIYGCSRYGRTGKLYGDMAEYKTSERFLMDSKASFDGKQVKQELMCSGQSIKCV